MNPDKRPFGQVAFDIYDECWRSIAMIVRVLLTHTIWLLPIGAVLLLPESVHQTIQGNVVAFAMLIILEIGLGFVYLNQILLPLVAEAIRWFIPSRITVEEVNNLKAMVPLVSEYSNQIARLSSEAHQSADTISNLTATVDKYSAEIDRLTIALSEKSAGATIV